MKTKISSIVFIIVGFVFGLPQNVSGQVSVLGTAITTGDFVGSSNTINLEFRANNNPQALILQSNGFFGIGPSFSPNFRLDVDAGDINLNTLNAAYRIGGNGSASEKVLWHNGNTSNIFVGVGAGNTTTNLFFNTFVGYHAGLNTSWSSFGDGSRNTFVGHSAGEYNSIGHENSFFGDSAGIFTTDGYHNTFMGASAGVSNLTGNSNVIIGFEAGYNSTANYNTMVGRAAGLLNQGTHNCFFGKDAADGNLDSYNCYFGSHAGSSTGQSGQNCAMGFDASRYTAGSNNCFMGYPTVQDLLVIHL